MTDPNTPEEPDDLPDDLEQVRVDLGTELDALADRVGELETYVNTLEGIIDGLPSMDDVQALIAEALS